MKLGSTFLAAAVTCLLAGGSLAFAADAVAAETPAPAPAPAAEKSCCAKEKKDCTAACTKDKDGKEVKKDAPAGCCPTKK